MERGLTNGVTATEVVEALISSSKESSKRSLRDAHRFPGCHVTAGIEDDEPKIVYWHRELPPLEAELVAEHTVEANSSRVRGTIAHRDELWDQCYRELMANAESRLVEEVARLGGHFAHVHDETIDPKHDDAAGEAWLHGRFSYMLYRRP
jgi:hypothetical protein